MGSLLVNSGAVSCLFFVVPPVPDTTVLFVDIIKPPPERISG